MSIGRKGAALLSGAVALVGFVAVAPWPEQGRAIVAADHPLASQAGADLLAQGGNAVDAAVAAALSAGVVQPAGSGLGGGGFAIGRILEDTFALDFRETAPRGIDPSAYQNADGAVVPERSKVGGLAVAVPGEPIGLATLVRRWGRMSLAEVARPAIRQAARGAPVGAHLSRSLGRTSFETITERFTVGERLARTGDVVKRPDLARTLRRWAKTDGRMLNEGAGAEAVVATVSGDGNPMTVAELADYVPKDRTPLVGRYREYTIITMPPPSSGGIALLQMLGALEDVDLTSLGHNSSAYVHRVTEAMKHAFADRANFLGDPDFVDVPTERLLSEERIAEIIGGFDAERTFETGFYGDPIAAPRDGGTQHISAIDDQGGAVALTTTINLGFGSGLIPERTGVILNNEMDDFALAPGVPNAFGLVGSEANAVEPGKRPLSSMTPTLVVDGDGDVVLAVGASGGSTIISATLQVLLAVVDFDMNPQEAVAAPRFHHQWLPEQLWLEPGFARDVIEALKTKGHEVIVRRGFSAAQAIRVTDVGLEGGADPRKGGWPAGVY
ncbi:MAG: gamma-glutamyltransferase [Myxococcota bacterium]